MSIIDKVASEYNVSTEEVEREIQEAIKAAMQEPKAREFWSIVCPNGKLPPTEEFIVALAALVK